MVRDIMRDPLFLARKSVPATKDDISIGRDLMDTLKAHREGCVGMAANMIGESKCVIIVNMGFLDLVMFNPVITKKEGRYVTEEGCLSLTGQRQAIRWETIEVEYTDMNWNKKVQTFRGFPAQIIQHEIDHCNGVLI